MKIIRKTKSVCPVCIKDLDADIIEEDNMVYMVKRCGKHGRFKILINEDSSFYKQLNKIYLAYYRNKPLKIPKLMYQLYLTSKCNLNCPICYINANTTEYNEPDFKYIKDAIKHWKNTGIHLFGGEPTLRKDLPDVIKCIEDTGNIPVLVTNGIKLTSLDYLKRIKSKKLKILFQFDGFDEKTYQIMRGRKLLDIKRKALDNIKQLNISSTLEVAVAKNINETQLGAILDFGVNNRFIKQICYRATGYLGKKGLHYSHTPTINNLIENLEKQTRGRVSKKDILGFQKLIYFLKINFSFLFMDDPCLYSIQYLLYREKDHYKPISELISLDIIEKDIDRYFRLFERGQKLKAFFLAIKICLKITNTSNFRILSKIFILNIRKKLIGSKIILNDLQDWLILRFSILCEPNTFDYTIASNCNSGEIKTGVGVSHCRGIDNIIRERAIVKKEL